MRAPTSCLHLARSAPRARLASPPLLRWAAPSSKPCGPSGLQMASSRGLTVPSAISLCGRARFASTTSEGTVGSSFLTWNEYLALRTKRRRLGLVFSVVCAGMTTAAGAAVLGAQDTEKLGAYSFGMDPIVVLGMATAACGAIGWLAGPFLGSGVFALLYRRVGAAMREKETEFYRRIARNRSDPTGQSVNNPVPDYYGEKITSVKDYRRWLKDQRAFRKKREVNVM